jgi:hypothetical protein
MRQMFLIILVDKEDVHNSNTSTGRTLDVGGYRNFEPISFDVVF